MNFSTKRRIDYLIGEPACWLLDFFVRFLGKCLKRDHRLYHSFRRVWIIKFVGLGTLVNAMPLIAALKERYSEAEFSFVTFPTTLPLAQRLPEINHIHVLHDHSLQRLAWDCLWLMLRAWIERPELVVDLEVHSRFSTLIATLSLARNRAGFYHSTSLFRSGLYTHLMFFNRFAHIRECHRQLGRMLGCEPSEELIPLEVSAEERREAREFLASLDPEGGRQVILLNPHTGPLCQERRWPGEKFAALAEALVKEYGHLVILIGSPDEAAENEALRRQVNPQHRESVHNAAGRLSFGGTLALIESARLLVTNDSGPLHFAAALGTPTVSLWGPSAAQAYAPRGAKHRVVSEPIYCSPCLHMADEPPCGGDNQCLKRLKVSKVLAAVAEVLDLPQGEAKEPEEMAPTSDYLPGYVARKSVPVR